LPDEGEEGVQFVDVSDVHTIHRYRPFGGLVHLLQQVEARALAPAGAPNESNHLARKCFERDSLQDLCVEARGVGKIDIVELDVSGRPLVEAARGHRNGLETRGLSWFSI
jgi:hypothetical protein